MLLCWLTSLTADTQGRAGESAAGEKKLEGELDLITDVNLARIPL